MILYKIKPHPSQGKLAGAKWRKCLELIHKSGLLAKIHVFFTTPRRTLHWKYNVQIIESQIKKINYSTKQTLIILGSFQYTVGFPAIRRLCNSKYIYNFLTYKWLMLFVYCILYNIFIRIGFKWITIINPPEEKMHLLFGCI